MGLEGQWQVPLKYLHAHRDPARTGDKSADVFPVVGSCCIGFDGGVADIPSQSPSIPGGSRELDLAAYWII